MNRTKLTTVLALGGFLSVAIFQTCEAAVYTMPINWNVSKNYSATARISVVGLTPLNSQTKIELAPGTPGLTFVTSTGGPCGTRGTSNNCYSVSGEVTIYDRADLTKSCSANMNLNVTEPQNSFTFTVSDITNAGYVCSVNKNGSSSATLTIQD